MGEQRSLINALLMGKRVDFTTRNGYYFLKLMHISLLLGAMMLFLMFVNRESSFLTIASIASVSMFLVFTFIFLRKNLIIASIKSDFLIVRTMNNKTILTSISTVRRLKTVSLGVFQLTTFECFLDGAYKPVVMISSMRVNPISPAKSILKAQEILEEKKANHKPDPVLYAS